MTAEGRTLGIGGDAGSGTQAFTYDALDRLIAVVVAPSPSRLDLAGDVELFG